MVDERPGRVMTDPDSVGEFDEEGGLCLLNLLRLLDFLSLRGLVGCCSEEHSQPVPEGDTG